jgi:hypothetical protein
MRTDVIKTLKKKYVIVTKIGDKWNTYLQIDHQGFCVVEQTTKKRANWFGDMLATALSRICFQPEEPLRASSELKEPVKNKEYYKPIESPRRYPLELGDDLHICLWSEDGKFKWTVAYFVVDSEGYNLHFVGERPFDPRVNWDHFRELSILGQRLANERFEKRRDS